MRPTLKRPENFFRTLGPAPRILLIRLRSLGDVVLMTPLLEVIKQVHSKAFLAVLVEHPFSEVLYKHPSVNQLLELRSSKSVPLPAPPAESGSMTCSSRIELHSRIEALRFLRQARFEVVWNLHGGTTSAGLTALSGARFRIGSAQFRHRRAYNVLIPSTGDLLGRQKHHTVEGTLAWFDWLYGNSQTEVRSSPPLTLVVDEMSRSGAQEKLKAAGVNPQKPYVVIQPAAVFETKEWLADRFAAVADFIVTRGFQVVLTGSSLERPRLERVQSHAQTALAILSELDIRELISVIAGAVFYLGNDSGPAHLAAALKKPSVILFGSSNSVAWGPWKNDGRVVQNPYDCNPCPGYRCLKFKEPECIKSITVDQVKRAVEQILDRHTRGV